jgi:hypothetical protein
MPDSEPQEIVVHKDKFDALLRKIANHPALKPDERKIGPMPGKPNRLKRGQK